MPVMAQQTTTYTYSLAELAKLIAENLKLPVEAVTVRYNLKDTDPEGFHGGTPSYQVGEVTVTVDVQKANQIKDGGPYVSTPSREYL